MKDLIDRQKAVECLNGEMKLSSFENAQIVQDYLVRAVEKLYDLPSAQQWIPVTERVPEKAGQYLCTLFDKDGTFLALVEWNETFGGRWQAVFEGEYSYSDIGNVLAWMPLPEPWKGEREEDGET